MLFHIQNEKLEIHINNRATAYYKFLCYYIIKIFHKTFLYTTF